MRVTRTRPPTNLDPPRRKPARWITVSCGMRGYYAALVDVDGCIDTGIGSYETAEGAAQEGRDWAEAEGLEFRQ